MEFLPTQKQVSTNGRSNDQIGDISHDSHSTEQSDVNAKNKNGRCNNQTRRMNHLNDNTSIMEIQL